MIISKLFSICMLCCIFSSIGCTMQEQKSTEVTKTSSDYEVIQIIEFDWNSIPIMFYRWPDNYYTEYYNQENNDYNNYICDIWRNRGCSSCYQGRYIQVSNDYNKYICDIWSHRINVHIKIGSKLDYDENEVVNKFTELSNRIKKDNNWDNVDNIIHELFGKNYSVLLSE